MKNHSLFPQKDTLPAMIIRHKSVLLTAAVLLVCGTLLGLKEDSAITTPSCAYHEDGNSGAVALEAKQCEHEILIADCEKCRFEVGIVRVIPSIAGSLIETGSVEEIDRVLTLKLTGQVQLDSTKTIDVASPGSGRVDQVKKFLGEKVQKGDILAVIHSDDLGQARAVFLEIQAKLELTQATFKREKDLYEQKITSQADYLDAVNELKKAEASYAAADKRLRLFGLETESIAGIKDEKENGEFACLLLRAPQSGTIIGQAISVGKMADTSESLFTIADLSTMWVWCDVYENDLAVLDEQFHAGSSIQAKVQVRAFESTVFNGAVDYVGNLMDEHTHTIKIRVQVNNPENKLKSGMFAAVDASIPLPGRMLAVPQAAVLSDAGKTFVFQQWKDDLWIRRDVVAGGKYGDWVEITSGVPRGARIVTGGAFMLKSDILREKMGAGCAD